MAKNKILMWTGTTYVNKLWPPGDPFKPDRDATKWRNSNRTTSYSLFNALCFFLTTGWPTESLDQFLDAIRPGAGWEEEWNGTKPDCHPDSFNRRANQNGAAVSLLFSGYWQPEDHPPGRKK